MLLPGKQWAFADHEWRSLQTLVEETWDTAGLFRGFERARSRFCSLGVNKKERGDSVDINYTRLCTLYEFFLPSTNVERKGWMTTQFFPLRTLLCLSGPLE